MLKKTVNLKELGPIQSCFGHNLSNVLLLSVVGWSILLEWGDCLGEAHRQTRNLLQTHVNKDS